MPRVFPHDLEAERSLLGSMLISKEACQDILNKCEDRDFYEESHKVLFNAMSELSRQNIPVDVTTITSYLLDHSQLDKVGGVEYLRQLSDSVPTLAHSEYYLKIIHNKSILRKIINETTKIAENAFGDIEDIDGFIDESEKTMLAITRDRNAGEFVDVKKVIREVTDRLNKLQSIDGNISGIRTNFRDLDKITSGLQKGDLIILAARPAMGKTAFALNIAHNVAFKSEDPVAIFSLEMPASQLVQRIICSMGGIEGSTMRTGEILKTNANKYYAAAERVSKCNLYIDDTPGVKINEIVAKCRKLKQEHGLKLIVIDYLQLITGSSNNRESRQQEVSDISRQLKMLARELDVPVIALSQLSRSVEQRPNKRPMMSDLRESGAIEQDADIVTFIYREGYYKASEGKRLGEERMYHQYREGYIEVICGCMFAGKTEELIRRINVLSYAKQKILVFKPKIDDRYSEIEIASHSGRKVPCFAIDDPEEILDKVTDDVQVVAIDEVQFFNSKIVDVCEYLADKGVRVMVAGLDKDFRGEAFGVMPELLTKGEFVTKLTAVCAKCGSPATRTQRLVDGKPASFDDPVVLVGAVDHYEPRCRHCHEVVNKPIKIKRRTKSSQ